MSLTPKQHNEVVIAAGKIIFDNEGKYGSVNKNDKGAVSVGKVQWHGDRALTLLKTIVNADHATAKNILGVTLFGEIESVKTWGKRILNADEASKVSKLLTTDQGKKLQDSTANANISGYISQAEALGVTDYASLIMHADIYNQRPASAVNIVKAAIKKAGAASNVTLDIYYQCAITDSVMKNYKARRDVVLKKLKALYPQKPAPAPAKPTSVSYKVVKGDNLSKIVKMVAAKYGIKTTVAKIAADNKINNPNLIKVGQTLTIRG